MQTCMQDKINTSDDAYKPVWPTRAVGVLSGVRDVFTSMTHVFTYLRH
jgi:hypothetical protein